MIGVMLSSKKVPLASFMSFFCCLILSLNWILMMLKNRRVKATGEACSTKIKPNRGCPQGGVLSPLLWSLCVDSLIQILRKKGLHITAYADDLAISTMGDSSKVCCDNLNDAMEAVEKWCSETELHVNPKKTEMVRFTKRYKLGLEMKKVTLFNEELHLSDNAKYLGVYLDSKLSMNEHVKQLYKKGTKSLWATRAMVSRTWGLSPKTMLWVYKQIILPRITYGSVITWKAIDKNKSLISSLERIQRSALLMATGAMRSTPTKALEVITSTIPIETKIKSTAILAFNRLKMAGTWKEDTTENGHSSIEFIAKKVLELNEEDSMKPEWFLEKKIETMINHKNNWNHDAIKIKNPIIFWCDASVKSDRCGIGVYCPQLKINKSIRLNDNCSISQAEMKAIERCANIMVDKKIRNKNVIIYSDSKAALEAINKGYINSITIKDCILKLNKLAKESNKITLCWVPSHQSILGNTIADKLAKDSLECEVSVQVPISSKNFDQIIKKWEMKEANLILDKVKKGKIFGYFIKSFDLEKFNFIKSINRKDIRVIIGFMTGHCGLREHLNKMGKSDETHCRLCNDGKENILHLLTECNDELIVKAKINVFKVAEINSEDLKNIEPLKLLKFAKLTNIYDCFFLQQVLAQ